MRVIGRIFWYGAVGLSVAALTLELFAEGLGYVAGQCGFRVPEPGELEP